LYIDHAFLAAEERGVIMGRLSLRLIVAAVFIFLLLPLFTVVVASFSAGPPLSFPPPGLTIKWYQNISPDFIAALKTSLIVGLGATALATVFGTLGAIALQRGNLPGRRLLTTLCLSPLMVPTLVIGVSLFQFTIVVWDVFGLSVGDTFIGIILGHSAFATPFVIRSVLAGQAHYDMSLEEAALNLGASPAQTFFRITAPLLMPGIVAGAIFAFLASFDDVPVALFLGGTNTVTLPVKIFTSIEFSFDASVMAVATIVVAGSTLLMIAVDRLIGLESFLGTART
jgi:putative spermidine/putrescine transport system permease protein